MLRIDEALKHAKKQGRKVRKKDIAARLWPNSKPATQATNMTNLCSGFTEKILPEWINVICEMTGVSADFLVGR